MRVFFYARQNDYNPEKAPGAPGAWRLTHNADIPEAAFRTVCEIETVAEEDTPYGRMPKKGISHKYRGPLFIDVDTEPKKGIMNIEDAFGIANKCIDSFVAYGLEYHQMEVFFSGSKGYHIIIPQEAFGIGDQFIQGLPYHYKLIAANMGLLKSIDNSIFSVGWGRMIRLPNRHRCIGFSEDGSAIYGPCKVQLTQDEFLEGPNLHRELAKNKRPPFPAQRTVNQKLSEMYLEASQGKKLRV